MPASDRGQIQSPLSSRIESSSFPLDPGKGSASGFCRRSAMAKNVRCRLEEALEGLMQAELRMFKAKLHQFPVKSGYDNIPKGRLEKADALDLSELLVGYYGEDYALEVTAAVLSESNCKPQAKRLLSATGKGACSLVKKPMPPFSTHSGKAERKSSSKQDLIPDPFAKGKCLCVKVKDCSEIQPTLVQDAKRTLKTYRIHIPEAGTFLCSVTDLKFEVRAAVTIEYTYSSWDQHLSEFVKQGWVVAGPVFDIRADPAEVAAVHLPHFICLQGGNIDTPQMEIAHIVDAGIMLEKPSQISPFHVVWKNPTFSSVAVLINPIYSKFFAIHSVVQLYKIRKKTTTLHLYLIPNDGSLIEAVREEEEKYNSILVRKHPQTDEPLYFGSRYYVPNSAEVKVNPKELEFSYKSPGQLQSFMEIYLRNCGRINLILKNKDNSVWDAWLEQEDLQAQDAEDAAREQRIQQVSSASGMQHPEKGTVISVFPLCTNLPHYENWGSSTVLSSCASSSMSLAAVA
ncbi:NACHT, LRR and PYD domains-containing protein 1a allele 5-like isoform X2 [Candoia aspera]|uniref:NACHT, LRR and PYD domains-containing protein 1a allele 5-like isoform X2 n=1 Tax=Candoia aspera TaxID=51853 RepID=UPI002FD81BE8